MNCPSCAHENAEKSRYCGRCRMSFSKSGLWAARFRDNLYWIFRRSNAGFMAGFVAWAFIPALSRVMSQDSSATMYFALEGLLGGAFLGTVGGMVEESTPKTIQGAFMGALFGALGGAVFGYFSSGLSAQGTVWGLFGFWALTGAGIGLVSALWERKPRKLLAGALAGLIGGGIGGGMRYAVFAYVIDEYNPASWIVRRLFEGVSGGIIGVTLWFAIAVAERLVVFDRKRIESGKTYKGCDHCGSHNPLPNWYCAACGSVLQESASPAQLHITPHTTLLQLSHFLAFLSRLSTVSGVIAAIVIFIIFYPVNLMLAIVVTILTFIAAYGLQGLFSALGEVVRIHIQQKHH